MKFRKKAFENIRNEAIKLIINFFLKHIVNGSVMKPKKQKILIDIEKLNRLNAEGCPVCKRKFTLGETVVIAYGPWQGAKYIHENEAVFDGKTSTYYVMEERRERSCTIKKNCVKK